MSRDSWLFNNHLLPNKTFSFSLHPLQASGTDSKLVMCGLTSIGHAIADTEDRGLLSICGFDLGAFNVIRNLALDLIWSDEVTGPSESCDKCTKRHHKVEPRGSHTGKLWSTYSNKNKSTKKKAWHNSRFSTMLVKTRWTERPAGWTALR